MEPISITAYKNDYKRGNEKAPDFRGTYKGVEVAVWKKKDKHGETCLSISVKDAQERGDAPARKSTPRDDWDAPRRSDEHQSPYPDMSDEGIPF